MWSIALAASVLIPSCDAQKWHAEPLIPLFGPESIQHLDSTSPLRGQLNYGPIVDRLIADACMQTYLSPIIARVVVEDVGGTRFNTLSGSIPVNLVFLESDAADLWQPVKLKVLEEFKGASQSTGYLFASIGGSIDDYSHRVYTPQTFSNGQIGLAFLSLVQDCSNLGCEALEQESVSLSKFGQSYQRARLDMWYALRAGVGHSVDASPECESESHLVAEIHRCLP